MRQRRSFCAPFTSFGRVRSLATLSETPRVQATVDAPPEAHAAMVSDIIGAHRQMIDRARAQGVKVIGATILPYGSSGYYHPGPESEADRQTINAWIRTPRNFDAVIDWDRALSDPDKPTILRGPHLRRPAQPSDHDQKHYRSGSQTPSKRLVLRLAVRSPGWRSGRSEPP